MARVWAESKHSGTELLMLLAIADFSDDDGRAYPSVAGLAEKCRMKPRNANYILAALQSSGELRVRQNEGPKGKNLYQIVFAAMARGLQNVAGLQGSAGMQPGAGVQSAAGLQSSARTPATDCAKPLQPIAAEPSLNHQEPSGRSLARPKRIPDCQFQAIVDLYHAKLPGLPRCRLMPKSRQDELRRVWGWVLSSTKSDGSRRASTAEEALEWFAGYFARASENDFLMGRTQRSPGHEKWSCDLDFLLTDKGMKQVIEKTVTEASA